MVERRDHKFHIMRMALPTIAITLFVSTSLVGSSANSGLSTAPRTILGGDARLGNPSPLAAAPGTWFTAEEIDQISATGTVEHVSLYRFGVDADFSTASDAILGTWFGNSQTGVVPGGMRSLHAAVIDPTSYPRVAAGGYSEFSEPDGMDMARAMSELDSKHSILLSTEAGRALGVHPGDSIRVVSDGITSMLEVIALAEAIPGIPWTLGLDANMNGSPTRTVDGCGVVSWATWHRARERAFQGGEVLIKNRFFNGSAPFIPGSSPPYWGSVGFPFSKAAATSALEPFLSNGSISGVMAMSHDPWPLSAEIFNDERLDYEYTNYTGTRWNNIPTGIVAVDTSLAGFFPGIEFAAVHPSIPASSRGSIESILSWARGNMGIVPCITSATMTRKVAINATGPSGLATMLTPEPGDAVRISTNNSATTCTVVATIAAGASWWYSRRGAVFGQPLATSPMTATFDPYESGSELCHDFGLASSPILPSNNAIVISKPDHVALLATAIGEISAANRSKAIFQVSGNVNFLRMDACDALLGFNGSVGDYATLLRVKLPPGSNATRIAASIQAMLRNSTAFENMTAVALAAVHGLALDEGRGAAVVALTPALVDSGDAAIASEIVTVLDSIGRTCSPGMVTIGSRVDPTLQQGIAGIVMASGIASVLAVVAAYWIPAWRDRAEAASVLATFEQHRALFPARRARRRAFPVTSLPGMVSTAIGTAIGFGLGILLAWLLVGWLPYMPALPVVLTMPWDLLSWLAVILTGTIISCWLGVEAMATRGARSRAISKEMDSH